METPESTVASRDQVREVAKKWLDGGKKLVMGEYSNRGIALLFLLALFSGALIKSLLNDSLTMGFDDYTLSRSHRIVDLNVLQKDLIKNGGSLAESGEAPPRGGTCFEGEK